MDEIKKANDRSDFKQLHPEYLTECDNEDISSLLKTSCLIIGANDDLVDRAIKAKKDGKPIPPPVDPFKN